MADLPFKKVHVIYSAVKLLCLIVLTLATVLSKHTLFDTLSMSHMSSSWCCGEVANDLRFLPSILVSSTTYNWLVKNLPNMAEKVMIIEISKLLISVVFFMLVYFLVQVKCPQEYSLFLLI